MAKKPIAAYLPDYDRIKADRDRFARKVDQAEERLAEHLFDLGEPDDTEPGALLADHRYWCDLLAAAEYLLGELDKLRADQA